MAMDGLTEKLSSAYLKEVAIWATVLSIATTFQGEGRTRAKSGSGSIFGEFLDLPGLQWDWSRKSTWRVYDVRSEKQRGQIM